VKRFGLKVYSWAVWTAFGVLRLVPAVALAAILSACPGTQTAVGCTRGQGGEIT
jgi:hypothetical protein